MVYEFIRIVESVQPKAFVMENVRGLHSMPLIPSKDKHAVANREQTENGSLLKDILLRFENIGYHVDCFLVNAVNYGAPQIRERLICIGNRYNIHAQYPSPRFSNRADDCLPPFRTLGDAIGNGFFDADPEIMNFSPRKLRYLSMVPPGGNWRNLPIEIQKESMGASWFLKGGRSAYWRRLSFDYPCPTIVTMPNHASTSLCHPSEVRALTVRECAAVQEFPEDWHFCGTTSQKYKQIGNAVPVRLGEVTGQVVKKLLDDISQRPSTATTKEILPSQVKHIRPHVRTRTYWKDGQVADGEVSYYDTDSQHQLELPLR